MKEKRRRQDDMKQVNMHPRPTHHHTLIHTFLHMFTPADTRTQTPSATQLDSVTHNTLQSSLTVRQNERPT